MDSVFVALIALGSLVLVFQVVLSMIGLDAEADFELADDVDFGDGGDGLDLLSVRSLAAAAAVFGAVGLWLDSLLWTPVAAAVALVPAFGAMLFSAWTTRLMGKAEADGSLNLDNAIGLTGRVNLEVPPHGEGWGLVALPLQGRSVELRAVTREKVAFPTGSNVSVVSVDLDTSTVEIVPPLLSEES